MHVVWLLLAVAWATPAGAQNAYVSDRLLLGLHADKALDAPVVRLLASGESVEVLERSGDLARVRTAEGEEGWVDQRYLSDVVPAATRVEQAETRAAASEAELEKAKLRIEELEVEREADKRNLEEVANAAQTAGRELEKVRQNATGDATALTDARAQLAAAIQRAQIAERRSDTSDATVRSAIEARAVAEKRAAAAEREAEEARQAMDREQIEFARQLQALQDNPRRPIMQKSTSDQSADRAGHNPRSPQDAASAGPQAVRASNSGPEGKVPDWLPERIGAWFEPYLGIFRWETWQWLLLLATLALSVALGAYSIDWQLRRRHGGFRV